MKTKTVAYVRVSTDKQAGEGHSLEAQEAKLKTYAALYELDLVELIVDAGVSAKTLDRDGLKRALKMLESGKAEALLVVKLDRLTRNVRDLGELLERYFAPGNCALLSVTEQIDTRSAAGRLTLNLLTAVAQWERESTGERVRTVMQHMKSNGQRVGGRVRYGFEDIDGKLVPVESEQIVIQRARQFHSQGRSYNWIAGIISAEGFKSRAGKPFHAGQVKKMLAAAAGGL